MVFKELREEIAQRKGESRERVGWYVYDWADQAFVSLVVAMFGPLFVNLMATEHAFAGDVTPSCNASVTCVTDRNSFLSGTGSCTYDGALLLSECRVCVQGEGMMMWNGTGFVSPPEATVWFFGDWSPVSMASWTISLSVMVQVVVFITFGAWADYGTIRHRGLIYATVIACIVDLLFIVVVSPSLYWLAATLFIVANVAYGLTIVYYYAYMPLIVDDHKEVVEAKKRMEADNATAEDEAAYHTVHEHTVNTISGIGNAFGYAGGFISLVLGAGVAFAFGSSLGPSLTMRVVLFLAGLWYLGFSILPFRALQPRPGPPPPPTAQLLTIGWKNTLHTLSLGRKYWDTMALIVIYFFYSDSYGTIASIGVLFAQDQVCMGPTELLLLLVIVQVTALFGSLLYVQIHKRFGWSTKAMINFSLFWYFVLCLIGLCGLLPGSRFGMKNKWEFYVFGIIHGINVGPIQAFGRALYADLSLPGHEAEFFALYEITDRGSSWLGPLVAAAILQVASNANMVFLYLTPMVVLPALALHFCVDHKRGMRAIGRLPPERSAECDAKL